MRARVSDDLRGVLVDAQLEGPVADGLRGAVHAHLPRYAICP